MAIAAADIGGTFTDLVMVGNDGLVSVDKRLSTRDDYGTAVTEGVMALLARSSVPAAAIEEIRHGTTVATNAVLERRGANTALITTAGFRDVLEIGRLRTPKLYDITWSKPRPLVPRRLRLEVDERMAADGTPVRPVDCEQVAAIGRELRRLGIDSVAVCLINAYVNDDHEQMVRRILQRHCPELDVSLSSEVLREMREFERTSTTVADAYVKPVMRAYLQRLKDSLRARQVTADIYVMQSNGGVLSLDETVRRPVYAIESGPAAGIIGARRLCLAIGMRDAVTFDMGGTTAKASIIENGEIDYSPEFEIGGEVSRNSRLIKGSGYLIRTPAIDVAEVGAGGGSIAWLDAASGLKVGPLSAGASPGPACYGFGGTQPTVTDANLVLGFLNPGGLAGGSVTVDIHEAKAAIAATVGRPLGIDVVEAAFGIHSIANANMARAIRAVSIERGRDIRKFRLVAFGGNGAIHAASLARMFGMAGVIVPPNPGVFSAVGLVFAEKEQHFVYTIPGSRIILETAVLAQQLPRFKAAALREFGAAAPGREPGFEWYADMRYVGQGHDLRIRIAEGEDADTVRQRFAEEHRLQYGHAFDQAAIEIMNLRVVVRERREPGARPVLRQETVPGAKGGMVRQCHFGAPFGLVEAQVLASRQTLDREPRPGPLVIEEYDTTIVVPPDFCASIDEANNVHLAGTAMEQDR